MTSLIFATSPLKIKSEIKGDASMISIAAMRPNLPRANQALRYERADVERQVHEQLLASFLGKEIDDAVERLVGAVGMQGRQHEVARLGELDPVFHGLAVTDLTDQDHIRAWRSVFLSARCQLSQSTPPRVRHHAPLWRARIPPDPRWSRCGRGLLVAVSDHSGERGRFARAGAATRITKPRFDSTTSFRIGGSSSSSRSESSH